MNSYKELEVWKKSRELVMIVYELTKLYPGDELYGLTNQTRRASVSIPANIAEAYGRSHAKERIQFLHIARGSLFEVETLITLACDIGYTNNEASNAIFDQITECKKLLNGLINYLKNKT
jgi:four helix bundle protein